MQLVLRVIGILGTIISVIWFITEPSFSTLSGILASLAAFLGSFIVPKQEKPAETLDQRNRRVMLDHVENFWVKGVLEKSLHGAALLDLGIKEDLGAITYPWGIKKESTDETLPVGKSMFQIFQEIGLGRSLLILGAPGSGKSTMLLELVRQLIERARHDDAEPIPVVFNLASWTEKKTISDWLAAQLNIAYYVPGKMAPKWVSENKMLLLLDGLDEVKAENRVKCVEAINQFRKEYGLTSLVVCSRIEEYSMLKAKVLLEGAITLQPLTSKQVNAFFDRFGTSLSSVKQWLNKNPDLEKLAETPLMLSIIVLAYKGLKPEELFGLKNKEDQRKYLFATYIDRMFERPTRMANSSFTKRQTLCYLSWLARKMKLHNITTYQLEAMQPSWLKDEGKRRSYKGLVVLSLALLFGLGVGLSLGLSGWLIIGMIFGLLFGLGVGLSSRLSDENIHMVDKLRWSWKEVPLGLREGLSAGWSAGLMVVRISTMISSVVGLIVGLVVAPVVGLFGGLIGGLGGGLSTEQVEETTHPGQRLKQTLFNSLSVMVSIGLIIGLIGGLGDDLILALSAGLIGGLIGGLDYGILALIQHFSLRLLLIRDGYLPRRLIAFLDYAVDLIFLRRVGGSYIFIHRLIMEHFAEMDV
jgi:hypothetical protein